MPTRTERGASATGVPQLAELCYVHIREGQCDLKDFYALPAEQLLELMGRLQQDYQTAAEKCDELASQIDRYIVDPPCFQHRVGQEVCDLRQTVVAKWTPCPRPGAKNLPEAGSDELCLGWEIASGRFVLEPGSKAWDTHAYLRPYQVMSSAMLLYRLSCLFPGDLNATKHTDGYKGVWAVRLTHEASLFRIELGEHKGAATIWPSMHPGVPGDASVTEEFRQDFLELLNLLFSQDMPHTYDGVVAGSVA